MKAMIHSKSKVEEVDIVKVEGDNKFIATLEDGTKCTAIYNCFVGVYYADDVYGVLEEKKEGGNSE